MFDLVVVGVFDYCCYFCYEFLFFKLVVICGNVLEIMVLVGIVNGGWGVDIIDVVVNVIFVV